MMETESDQTIDAGNPRRCGREQSGNDDPAGWPGGHGGPSAPGGAHASPRRDGRGAADLLDTGPGGQEQGEGYRGRHSQSAAPADGQRPAAEPWPYRDDGRQGDGARGAGGWDAGAQDDGARRDAWGAGAGSYRREDAPVARRTATGWRVGDEEVSDLTSAMVLADLLAAELPAKGPPTPGNPAALATSRRGNEAGPPDARQLQETVAQLEHALTVRVRVEQAIGVLAERHRLRPRQAFELLRSAARSRGRRVLEVAGEVVDSASNPLLRLPEELAKPPMVRRGRRTPRRPHVDE
jgi:ANTAR domain